MNGWLSFWTFAMLISGALFFVITLVVAVGGLRDLRTMLRGFSQAAPSHTEDMHGER